MSNATTLDLRRDGATVVPGVLDPDMLARLRVLSGDLLGKADPAHRAAQRSTGSLIQMAEEPRFADLIAYPAAFSALEKIGLPGARFSSGYLISKPPGGPPLFWHQDWWGWSHPISFEPSPAQVFLMYYLVDTTPANGCLRIIPGSHLRRTPIHDRLPSAHAEDLARVENPNDPIYGSMPGEVAIPVKAGDLVVGDARLLHSAYANQSVQERSLLTLWYHPNHASLPEPLQSRIACIMRREDVDTDPNGAADGPFPEFWPKNARTRIAGAIAVYEGNAEPLPWSREPNPRPS